MTWPSVAVDVEMNSTQGSQQVCAGDSVGSLMFTTPSPLPPQGLGDNSPISMSRIPMAEKIHAPDVHSPGDGIRGGVAPTNAVRAVPSTD